MKAGENPFPRQGPLHVWCADLPDGGFAKRASRRPLRFLIALKEESLAGRPYWVPGKWCCSLEQAERWVKANARVKECRIMEAIRND